MKFTIAFSFLFILMLGIAQDPVNSQNYQASNTRLVQWVSQYPVDGIQKTRSSFLDQVAQFVFGKRNIPKITKPNAILASNPLSFLVMDQGSATLFKVQNNEKRIPKALKKEKFNFPSLVCLCSFSNNEILFTDSRLGKIYVLNEEQKKLKVLNDELVLRQPTGIAYAAISKEIWVVETGAHRISILNEQGERIRTIGKRGARPGEFNYPTDIWIDKDGKAYVIDAMNFRIQIFDIEGQLISMFGEAGDATGYFARPKGIATDSFGNIYISDALFHTVQIFDFSGNYLYNFGEQGREKGQFWMPSGIFIDDNNFIYVADSYNSRVQLFQLNRRE